MRGLPALTLLAALSALLPVAGAEAARDTIVIGMALEPPHLDPTAGAAAAIDEVTYANVFESLTRVDETGSVIPGLAESWTVSDDGLTYVFALVQGVKYHDGSNFDPSDVVFSLNRARAEDSTNAQKGYFAAIADVEATGSYEVTVKLSRPDGLFLFNMGSGDASMVAPESAETNKTNPIGTGPFRFVDWKQGDRIELEKADTYRDPAAIHLSHITFRFISDPAAEVAALLAGDVDVFPVLTAPEALEQFKADPRFSVVVGTTEGDTIMAVNQRRAPFDDVRVRRALAHAIDRQAIIDGAMFGYGTPIGSHFAPHNPAYVDLTGAYPYDPDQARSLLDEAGYPEGFSTTLTLPPVAYARRGGEIIQAQLAEVGIEAELIPVEWAEWLEKVFKGYDYDMTIVSHTEPLDIGIYARGDEYYFGYDNPAFNEVIAELDATVDPAARTTLYQEAQNILSDDEAAIFLFSLAKTGVANAEIHGLWANSPIQANDMTGVYWED